jgi:hypothetical protein
MRPHDMRSMSTRGIEEVEAWAHDVSGLSEDISHTGSGRVYSSVRADSSRAVHSWTANGSRECFGFCREFRDETGTRSGRADV